nr:hypothetical protein [Nostocaceae cyanobacterium]
TLVNTYQCEWKTTIADPEKVSRFQHFINSPQPDPGIVKVEERGQLRPAYEHEKALV